MIRLFHDDVRPAPEGWILAKTNDEAIDILITGEVIECSLDHDLGDIPTGETDPQEVMFLKGTAEETGVHLVEWMIKNDCVPDRIQIHSWNPQGAQRMANLLKEAGHSPIIAPFQIP